MYVIAKKLVLEEWVVVLLIDGGVAFDLAFRTRMYKGSVDVRCDFSKSRSSIKVSALAQVSKDWSPLLLLLSSFSLRVTASFWMVAIRKRCEVVDINDLKPECRDSETEGLLELSYRSIL